MLKNYFKIAWRNLLKSRVYSSINITGLATGMAVALLIGLWIWDEITFNTYFENHRRLGQVMITQVMKNEYSSSEANAIPVGAALRSKYADNIKYVSYVSWNDNNVVAAGEKNLSVSRIWVEKDFPDMFTLHLTEGKRDVLNDPSTVMISQSLAKALFGNTAVLNRIIRVGNKLEMKVGAVYEDFPRNTIFYDTKLLMPWENQDNWRKGQTDWQNHMCRLFVEINGNTDFEKTTARIKNLPTPFIKEWHEEIMVHPLDKVHLYNDFEKGKAVGGNIKFVWMFGIIGIFVLLLACINFMNLSTARSEKRAKEVGIRKTVGSLRKQLIGQFLSESIVVAFISLFVALLFVQLSLPFFNRLADKQMRILFDNPFFWIIGLCFTFFTGLIAGSYPAFYLSGFRPIKVLKGTFHAGRYASLPRKILVVVQFTVSIALIIATIIIFQQIQYAKHRPVGYDREGLITIPLSTSELAEHYQAIRNDLLQTGTVENVSESSYATTGFDQNNSIDWRGKDPGLVIFFRDVNVTYDFGKTIGWHVVQGRDFSRDFLADSGTTAIINEATAKVLGFKNPIGEIVKWQGKNHTIIGVVKDMVTQSPYDPVEPGIFFLEGWMGVINIRMKAGGAVSTTLSKIEKVFKKYNPSSPFEFNFNDDVYAQKFSDEERIGNLATFFAILAIFISCLGLFGLASFVAEQRTKEIGVRKVLGASILNVWTLLTKDFLWLVMISFLIAAPISYYFMHGLLSSFTYRTTISWIIFAIVGCSALLITIITVGFQAIRAAVANPVKSLRTE